MKRKVFSALILLSIIFSPVFAQTQEDSIAIAQIKWETSEIQGGAIVKTANVTIFGTPQQLSLVQYNPQKYKTIMLQPERRVRTSYQAKEINAKAAINGSYFNMKTGAPTTYIKIKGKEYGNTTDKEVYRVDGAITINKKNIEIHPWNADTRDALKKKYKNVMSSGPLLVKNNNIIKAKSDQKFFGINPRTLVGITKDKQIILMIVDGRHKGHATGMTINQLAYLSKQLGMVDALNLDGGGSSCLWTNKQGIVSYPYDNKKFDHAGERQVSNIIAIK